MRAQLEATGREAVLVEDAASIRMMGLPVLEALPSRRVPVGCTNSIRRVCRGNLYVRRATSIGRRRCGGGQCRAIFGA